jgi:hypothetical protein
LPTTRSLRSLRQLKEDDLVSDVIVETHVAL